MKIIKGFILDCVLKISKNFIFECAIKIFKSFIFKFLFFKCGVQGVGEETCLGEDINVYLKNIGDESCFIKDV